MIKSIGVLAGGYSAEREISLKTCAAVEKSCLELSYKTTRIDFDGNIPNLIAQLTGIEFVFIALHGGIGENGVIQGVLEALNIPYNGSGVLASAIGMEKSLTKLLVQSLGILTPRWQIFSNISEAKNFVPKNYPVVVKPSADGSTIGLSIVNEITDLSAAFELAAKYDGKILVEDFIAGRELTVTIIGQKVLPIIEIVPKHEIYDFECKYQMDMSEYICPAELSTELTNEIKNKSLKIFNLLNCKGYARADFILDEKNNPWFLEINTLPGMTRTSLVPKSALVAKITFNELIQQIINESLKK